MVRKEDHIKLLHQTGPQSLMGKLLRRFWQPIARSQLVAKGEARGVKVLGEELTLYRGEGGAPHLVGGRCAHRCTVLHTGWVEGDTIRCTYHGWQYEAGGKCIDIPAERKRPRAGEIRIASYPVHEYAGLVFAWLGGGTPMPFDLPRKHVLEDPSRHIVVQAQMWDCNWFQQIENSLDAVHVSFLHTWGRSTRFDQGITTAIPELRYAETSAGIRQEAHRSKDNVRVSDWTFPNNNHVVAPGAKKGEPWSDISVYAVPIDDTHTMRFTIHSFHPSQAAAARAMAEGPDRDYDPSHHRAALFDRHEVQDVSDLQFISLQDYVAVRGQGPVADRLNEHLSVSDEGILFLRRIFLRELELIEAGKPTKEWRRIEEKLDLPVPAAEAAQ